MTYSHEKYRDSGALLLLEEVHNPGLLHLVVCRLLGFGGFGRLGRCCGGGGGKGGWLLPSGGAALRWRFLRLAAAAALVLFLGDCNRRQADTQTSVLFLGDCNRRQADAQTSVLFLGDCNRRQADTQTSESILSW